MAHRKKSRNIRYTAAATGAGRQISVKKLNYFVATEMQKAFSISTDQNENLIYFGNNDERNILRSDGLNNTLCFENNDTVYHNLYDSAGLFYKSAIYKVSKSARTGTTYDFQDIVSHRPACQLCGMLQLDNVIYALETQSVSGHYDISCDIYSAISVADGKMYPDCEKIQTVTYDRDYISAALESSTAIDPVSAIARSRDFVAYNTIHEMPGTVRNDYQSGNIIANTFKTKNQYNSVYDMGHSDNYEFSNCRQYVGIEKCGGQLYAKYYDRYFYAAGSGELSDSNADMFGYKMQHIEAFGSVNRYSSINGHKSNLYSLIVNTNMLNELNEDIDDQKARIKKNICQEITNISRKIAESLQPAQTQLLSVYVRDVS